MNIPFTIVLIVKRDKIGGIHMKKLVIVALVGIGVVSSLGFVSGKEKETGTVATVSYADTLQSHYVDDNGNGVCDHYESRQVTSVNRTDTTMSQGQYVDEDNNGICDHYENRVSGDGCHEHLGGHHRYRHGN